MAGNKVLYANDYARAVLGINETDLTSLYLFDIFTKATAIFFESYIRPAIVDKNECTEVQITILSNKSKKTPATANARLIDGNLFWSIHIATERDLLYQELIEAREHLIDKSEELLKQSRLDPLTNLLNRRAAHHDIAEEFEKIKRTFIPLSFLLIDIDWFKEINDTLGHDVGDDVLRKLSKTLSQTARHSDIVARWGGEEFLIVLYNSDDDNAEQFCIRLHKAIADIELQASIELTVSIGVSSMRETHLTIDDPINFFVKRADKALYNAKENGKAQTSIWNKT